MTQRNEGTFDADQIKDIKRKLSEELVENRSDWKGAALQYLITVVEELNDENESLWFMVDELKSSKMDSRHTKILNDKIQGRLLQLRLLQGRKGEA